MAATPPLDSGNTTTYVGPTPGSGQYGIYQAQAQAAYQQASQQIGNQRTAFLGDQGLTGTYDANHNFTGATNVDPNAHGAYQQMTAANAGQGMSDDAAIGALGFGGGLSHQMHEQANQNYSALAANWAQNAQGQLNSFEQQGQQNQQDYTNNLFSGLQDSIQTAIANGTYNPADYSGLSINGQTLNLPTAAPPLGGTGAPGVYNGGGGGGTPTGPQTWTIGGKTVYGFGLQGTPFYDKAKAIAAGRLGKKGK